MTIDYKKAWEKLRLELAHLNRNEVQQVHPVIILAYMDFIEDIEQWESKEEK